MSSVEELKKIVSETHVDRRGYDGVSDHLPHIQSLVFRTEQHATVRTTSPILFATFNVLNPKFMYHISGVKQDGSAVHGWKAEEKQGLEHCSFADEQNREARVNKIVDFIVKLIKDSPHSPFILALQECWLGFENRLKVSLFNQDVQFIRTLDEDALENYCMFLLVRVPNYAFQKRDRKHISIATQPPNGPLLTVVNVHMEFSSQKNLALLREIATSSVGPILVMGDFNIPVKPISQRLLNEGVCTLTLDQVVDVLCKEFQVKIDFFIHPSGWTNFNHQGNCRAEEDGNHDHFDNVMLITPQSAANGITVKGTPINAKINM
jgi:hypothetical protein